MGGQGRVISQILLPHRSSDFVQRSLCSAFAKYVVGPMRSPSPALPSREGVISPIQTKRARSRSGSGLLRQDLASVELDDLLLLEELGEVLPLRKGDDLA